MVGEASVTLGVGKKKVCCSVWVANLEDCIVGLDVLRALDCVINARSGTLTFPDGEVVQMSGRPSRLDYSMSHQVTVLTTESVGDASTYNPRSDALSGAAAISASDCTLQVPAGAQPLVHYNTAVPPVIPPVTETTSAASSDSAERVVAIREVWLKNCDGLSLQEQKAL